MFKRIMLWLAFSGLVIAPSEVQSQTIPTPTGVAQGGPDAYLTSRGLTRLGNVYVLKAELEKRDELAKQRRALDQEANRLQAMLATQQGLSLNLQQNGLVQQQLQSANTRLTNERRTLIDSLDPSVAGGSNTQVRGLIDNLDQQIRNNERDANRAVALGISLGAESVRNAVDLQNRQATVLGMQQDLSRRISDLITAYRTLGSDPNIYRAFRDLNAKAPTWTLLGPEWEYEMNIGEFAKGIVGEAGFVLDGEFVVVRGKKAAKKQRVPKLVLPEVKALTTLAQRIVVLDQRIRRDPTVASRRELADSLTKSDELVAKIGDAYDYLTHDELAIVAADKLGIDPTKRVPPDDVPKSTKRIAEVVKSLKREP